MSHSKDRLADELRKIGLYDMAEKAANGLYHDFLSPLATPAIVLNFDLLEASIYGNKQANELRLRFINGEFDATKEESDEWAKSPEATETFRELMNSLKKN